METAGAYLAVIAACFVALVFLRAALHKAGSYAAYVGNLRNYRVLPDSLAAVAAPTLFALECMVVVGLVLPQTRLPAAILAAGLLVGYAAAIAVNLARGRTTIDCGCGGGGQGISSLHVVRNVVLALFALPVMVWSAPVAVALFPAAAACVLVLWLTFLVFDQLLGNHTHVSASTYSRI